MFQKNHAICVCFNLNDCILLKKQSYDTVERCIYSTYLLPQSPPQPKPSRQPLGCYPFRSVPSFQHEQEQMKNRRIERRSAFGPWCRSSRRKLGLSPYCQDGGFGRYRRRRPRRNTFCLVPGLPFYRCRQPGVGNGSGWWSFR